MKKLGINYEYSFGHLILLLSLHYMVFYNNEFVKIGQCFTELFKNKSGSGFLRRGVYCHLQLSGH